MKISTDLDVRGVLTVAGVPIAAGSTILSGTATPTSGDGAVGDYYLETDAGVLYGPKVSTHQYIETIQVEPGPGPSMYGMRHRFLTAGQVVGVRLRVAPGGVGDDWEVYLFTNAGTLLASKNVSGLVPGTWTTVLFDTAVTVAEDTTYVAAVWTPAGASQLGANSGAFSGQTSGDVRILADNEDGRNAIYGATRDSFPTLYAGLPTIQLSAVFVANQWPVALKSVPANAGTILSGTATPTAATGAVGDYYLDTDDRVLYGPKIAVPAPTPQFIETVPNFQANGADFMFGQKHRFLKSGFVTSVRVYWTAGVNPAAGVWEVYLFNSAGTMLASQNGPAVTGANAYVEVTFSAPVAVAANTTYIPAMFLPSALGPTARGYSNVLGGAGQTVGDVRLLAYGEDGPHNVYTAAGRDSFPNESLNGTAIFCVAATFVADAAIPWPVALKSVPPGGTTGQVLKKTSGTDYAVGWVPLTQITHPNTDDVLVQAWDATVPGWQTIHYDSGWRSVTPQSGYATNHPGLLLHLRRIGGTVFLSVQQTTAGPTGAAATQIYTLPAGFTHNGNSIIVAPLVNQFGAPITAALWASGTTNVSIYRAPSSGHLGQVMFTTGDAPPTGLPGTLVSAAPA